MHLFLLQVLACFKCFQKCIFDSNTCTLPKSPNNGFRWCPLGKWSHLGLEQLYGEDYDFKIDSCVIHEITRRAYEHNNIPYKLVQI